MTEPTYYQVLQVDPNALPEVIEAAYRRLAKIYHPDVNKSPDAERKMKQINIAYQVLHDPVTRWQYHGTLQWHNPSSSSIPKSKPTGEVRRQTLRKMAWLKSQNRTKEGYFISIGNATDFDLTIEMLKANVPVRARNYNPTKKEWWISEDYEGVLEELFYNFTPRSYHTYPEPTRMPAYASDTARGGTYSSTRSLSDKRNTSYGKQQSNQGGWIVVVLIVVSGVWWFVANSSAGSSSAPPTATATVGDTGRFATAPVVTATNTTQPTSTPRPTTPTLHPTTVRESNIREGPSPDFPIVRTVTSGTKLDLVGYNDDRDVVWYKLHDGTWIWGDLVRNAPEVPYVDAPVLLAVASATPILVQDCRGGCTTRPTWCEPPIKGNVSYETGERIYHVPGQEYYDATVINPSYGERWFCTEQEAINTGWRKSWR